MNLQALQESLIKHEGVRARLYFDTEGVPTIGIGRNLNEPLSDKAIMFLYQEKVDESIAELDRAFKGWRNHSSEVQTVLIELQFAMGAPRLAGFKKMWAALKAKDYPKAATELLNSKWSEQVGKRAVTLAEQMRNG